MLNQLKTSITISSLATGMKSTKMEFKNSAVIKSAKSISMLQLVMALNKQHLIIDFGVYQTGLVKIHPESLTSGLTQTRQTFGFGDTESSSREKNMSYRLITKTTPFCAVVIDSGGLLVY